MRVEPRPAQIIHTDYLTLKVSTDTQNSIPVPQTSNKFVALMLRPAPCVVREGGGGKGGGEGGGGLGGSECGSSKGGGEGGGGKPLWTR